MRAGSRGASASVEKRIGGGAQPPSATIDHHRTTSQPSTVGRNEFWWGHATALTARSSRRVPVVLRAELLTLVPHSMSTIDRLEAKSQFPKHPPGAYKSCGRLRREVAGYLRHFAKRTQSAAKEDHVNQEFVTAKRADCRANGGDRKGEAIPTINENPSAAPALAGYVSKPAEHWKKEP